jgi:hypothetical protein
VQEPCRLADSRRQRHPSEEVSRRAQAYRGADPRSRRLDEPRGDVTLRTTDADVVAGGDMAAHAVRSTGDGSNVGARHLQQTQPAATGLTRSAPSPPTATDTEWTAHMLSAALNRGQKLDAARAQKGIRRARVPADQRMHAVAGQKKRGPRPTSHRLTGDQTTTVEGIRPGDRVLFEADEEHRHGAAPNRPND